MAMINSSSRSVKMHLPTTTTTTRWKEREITSPERTKVWSEPLHHLQRKLVPVVYYLSRNGQLEHPHFIEVPLLSSSPGLYLRDVITRLDVVRGNGMANMYSWSSKRRYKNGFVWHDLAENDFIYPAHGQEYVLKGSEIHDGSLICRSDEIAMSFSSRRPSENGNDSEFPAMNRRRNQSWCATDFQDYKSEPTGIESSEGRIAAADASTQTEDKRRRRRAVSAAVVEEEEEQEKTKTDDGEEDEITELNTEEISPPPSDSSPETLESLMNTNSRLIFPGRTTTEEVQTPSQTTIGRLRAPSVLMQLISCGSVSFNDSSIRKSGDGNGRLGCNLGGGDLMEKSTGDAAEITEEKEKEKEKESFSGRLLIETKEEQFSIFKRWSFNATATAAAAAASAAADDGQQEQEESSNLQEMERQEGASCMQRRKSKSNTTSAA